MLNPNEALRNMIVRVVPESLTLHERVMIGERANMFGHVAYADVSANKIVVWFPGSGDNIDTHWLLRPSSVRAVSYEELVSLRTVSGATL